MFSDSQLQGLAGVVRCKQCMQAPWPEMGGAGAGGRKQFTSLMKEVKIMKEAIQPKYYQATVTCNCGNTFVTGSTKPEIHVEVCSKCHSFYTGTQKATAARGRIDKFNRKYGIK